jgi:hypothetical protein
MIKRKLMLEKAVLVDRFAVCTRALEQLQQQYLEMAGKRRSESFRVGVRLSNLRLALRIV